MGQLRSASPFLDRNEGHEKHRDNAQGVYLEVSGQNGFSLKTESLDDFRAGMRVVNIEESHGQVRATVYAADGGRKLVKKIDEYREKDTKYHRPRNADLVNGIESIEKGTIRGLWAGREDGFPVEGICSPYELWLNLPQPTKERPAPLTEVLDDYGSACQSIGIESALDEHIEFPGLTVLVAKVDFEKLNALVATLSSKLGYVVGIRDVPEPNTFFLEEFTSDEQMELAKFAADRTISESEDAAVCLFDTGVNRQHPMLSKVLSPSSLMTYNPAWGVSDTGHGGVAHHGSLMAGVAGYGDVRACLAGMDAITIHHVLESVKILPPNGDNKPEYYPYIMSQSVSLAEIQNPSRSRAICMAVTASAGKQDGTPTAWSATIDQLASGANEPEDDTAKRLFVLSAGNIGEVEYNDRTQNVQYPSINVNSPIQDPAQSWNALTVGAYSRDDLIGGDPKAGAAVAPAGGLSPFSRTSMTWDAKWPVKPDIVCDGGNLAKYHDPYDPPGIVSYTRQPDLDVLTTSATPLGSPFATFNATSAATAQASCIAAELMGRYPQLWPETIRGLIVQSARWTRPMLEQFIGGDRAKYKRGYAELLRTCGYGVPSLSRAVQCMENSVNLIVQDEIVPFVESPSGPKLNEVRFYELPWPHSVLRQLGEADATLRITLSYFIEPVPEAARGERYKYPSHGLRFEVVRKDESKEEFKRSMSLNAEGKRDRKRSGSSINWTLGTDNRDMGSLHSDFAEMSAVDLSEMNYIAIYPVKGWWATRKRLGRVGAKARFALIVTITTPGAGTDLYTEVATEIANAESPIVKVQVDNALTYQ